MSAQIKTPRKMLSVSFRLSYESMRTLESMVAMDEGSEDPEVARIATVVRKRITKAIDAADAMLKATSPQPTATKGKL